MEPNEPSSAAGATRQTPTSLPGGGRVAAFIYTGLSVLVAVIFLLVTSFTASYPAVARYGGAAWVFLLMMIVLMPIVIPRVNRRKRRSDSAAHRGEER